jgi:DNA-binding transcriptional ArsR family regulator
MTRFRELDPVLHSRLRLAIVSLLMGVESAEFTFIKEKTGATAGNLSIQVTRLKEAGYIDVAKKFQNNYPLTTCRVTPLGRQKFEAYVNALKEYLYPGGE